MTQLQLAKATDVDFSYISKLETDKTNFPPSEAFVSRLANVLDPEHAEELANELLELAGSWDSRKLHHIASEVPEVGLLLRRLQLGKYTPEQIRKFLDEEVQ
jgi:transcriptional regulator with XRE-family HTH domain